MCFFIFLFQSPFSRGIAQAARAHSLSGATKNAKRSFFVHQKECFSVRDFPPEKRRLRSDSVVLLPHTKASTSLTPQMPDACEGLYFSVKISPPSSSFFMERPTRVQIPIFKNQPISKPYGRLEGFSYLNLFVSGQRESNYTGLKLQRITIDKLTS